MVTQDARGRCRESGAHGPRLGGPKGSMSAQREVGGGPQNQTHAKPYLPPSNPSQLPGRKINTLTLCPAPRCTGEGPAGEFSPPPTTDRGQRNAIYIQCSQSLAGHWENPGRGTGWL